jgi:hypothetical protein
MCYAVPFAVAREFFVMSAITALGIDMVCDLSLRNRLEPKHIPIFLVASIAITAVALCFGEVAGDIVLMGHIVIVIVASLQGREGLDLLVMQMTAIAVATLIGVHF